VPVLREGRQRNRQVSLTFLNITVTFVVQGRHIMKLVAEYLADAIKFDQMAEDATDAALKGSFRKQAARSTGN
jgi:hypothetical protein